MDCTHAKDVNPWVVLKVLHERCIYTCGACCQRGGERGGDEFVYVWCMVREWLNYRLVDRRVSWWNVSEEIGGMSVK